MRFTISVKEPDKLKSFLSSNDVEYLDVFANNSIVYFISDTAEVYSHIYFNIVSREDMKDSISFRLDRKMFISMVIEGFLDFNFGEKIELKFRNLKNEYVYAIKIDYQTCFTSSYQTKLALLDDLASYSSFDISELSPIVKIAKSMGTLVGVNDNVCYISNSNIMIFKEVNAHNFTLAPTTLAFMLRYASLVYNVQNYIIVNEDNISIIARKYKDIAAPEYKTIKELKSSHKIVFMADKMVNLCRKCGINDGTFTLDLENKKCEYSQGRVGYSAPIDIFDINSSRAIKVGENLDDQLKNLNLSLDTVATLPTSSPHKLPKLVIPSIVLKNILNVLYRNQQLTMYIKKNFIQMQFMDVVFVFKKIISE